MNPDTKLLLEHLERHNDAVHRRLSDSEVRTREELRKHGEYLARIDERTKNQDRRLDRIDRRAAGFGAATAALVTGAGAAVWKWIGGGGA